MAKKKLVKDLSRRARLAREHRRNDNSCLWKNKAHEVWAFIVRESKGNQCEMCGLPEAEGQLHAHHALPKERYQWLRYAPINGVCLCVKCHKVGRYAAHRNAVWFAMWLQEHRPNTYAWVLKHMHDEERTPPTGKAAYEYLLSILPRLGLLEKWQARCDARKTKNKKAKDTKNGEEACEDGAAPVAAA